MYQDFAVILSKMMFEVQEDKTHSPPPSHDGNIFFLTNVILNNYIISAMQEKTELLKIGHLRKTGSCC